MKTPRGIDNKNSQLWTMYLMKKTLMGTDFGATILIQLIPISLESVWRIGMIMNEGRNRRKWITEGKKIHIPRLKSK